MIDSVVARIQPVTRSSLADTAYDSILNAILSGSLHAGEEVSEVSLAAALGISRTPVAQAVQRLAAIGLIDRSAGTQPKVAKFDRDEVREVYEMREILEGESAARSAVTLPVEWIETLSVEADRLIASTRLANWSERVINFDIRFHDELAAASGNRYLTEKIRQYRLLVRAFCRSTARRENLIAAMTEHRQILAALVERDPVAARQAMVKHVNARKEIVLAEMYPTNTAK